MNHTTTNPKQIHQPASYILQLPHIIQHP